MYCPRCSQEQVLEDIKFCPRCGLPLALVAGVLAHDGSLPPQFAAPVKKKKLTRRSGLIFSLLWFLFFALLMAPIVSLDNQKDAFVMLIFGVMGSLIMVILSFAFLKNEPTLANLPNQNTDTGKLKNLFQKNQAALPPSQSIPASAYVPSAQGNWRDTKDLVQPSVTDNTTKLLSRDE